MPFDANYDPGSSPYAVYKRGRSVCVEWPSYGHAEGVPSPNHPEGTGELVNVNFGADKGVQATVWPALLWEGLLMAAVRCERVHESIKVCSGCLPRRKRPVKPVSWHKLVVLQQPCMGSVASDFEAATRAGACAQYERVVQLGGSCAGMDFLHHQTVRLSTSRFSLLQATPAVWALSTS